MQCRQVTVTGEVTAEQLAVVDATHVEFENVQKKSMAMVAFDLLLEVDPGSHEARRLHEMIQSGVAEVRGPRSRVGISTHEFDTGGGRGGRHETGGGGCAHPGVDVRPA